MSNYKKLTVGGNQIIVKIIFIIILELIMKLTVLIIQHLCLALMKNKLKVF